MSAPLNRPYFLLPLSPEEEKEAVRKYKRREYNKKRSKEHKKKLEYYINLARCASVGLPDVHK